MMTPAGFQVSSVEITPRPTGARNTSAEMKLSRGVFGLGMLLRAATKLC